MVEKGKNLILIWSKDRGGYESEQRIKLKVAKDRWESEDR